MNSLVTMEITNLVQYMHVTLKLLIKHRTFRERNKALADLGGGAWGTHAPPWASKFFRFHAVFGKIWRVHAPPGGFTPPPSGKSWIRHCKGNCSRFTLSTKPMVAKEITGLDLGNWKKNMLQGTSSCWLIFLYKFEWRSCDWRNVMT